MLEGSVGEELFSHAKQKTCHILHTYKYPVPQNMIQEYFVRLTFYQ